MIDFSFMPIMHAMSLMTTTTLIVICLWCTRHYELYKYQIIITLFLMLFTSLYNSPWLWTVVPETHHINRFLWDLSYFVIAITLSRIGLRDQYCWGNWLKLEITTRYPNLCNDCIATVHKHEKSINNIKDN